VIIRECTQLDLDALEAAHPANHEERFARQRSGDSTYLTLRDDDGTSVGSGEIMWTGAKEPEVRTYIPDCPELNGLTVWPPERQSHGIGTRMIEHATQLVRQRGFARVGLASNTSIAGQPPTMPATAATSPTHAASRSRTSQPDEPTTRGGSTVATRGETRRRAE
jgi:GNAT superfamily N-acetyltransferase